MLHFESIGHVCFSRCCVSCSLVWFFEIFIFVLSRCVERVAIMIQFVFLHYSITIFSQNRSFAISQFRKIAFQKKNRQSSKISQTFFLFFPKKWKQKFFFLFLKILRCENVEIWNFWNLKFENFQEFFDFLMIHSSLSY